MMSYGLGQNVGICAHIHLSISLPVRQDPAVIQVTTEPQPAADEEYNPFAEDTKPKEPEVRGHGTPRVPFSMPSSSYIW